MREAEQVRDDVCQVIFSQIPLILKTTTQNFGIKDCREVAVKTY